MNQTEQILHLLHEVKEDLYAAMQFTMIFSDKKAKNVRKRIASAFNIVENIKDLVKDEPAD